MISNFGVKFSAKFCVSLVPKLVSVSLIPKISVSLVPNLVPNACFD